MDTIEFEFIGKNGERYPMVADAKILEVMKTCSGGDCESNSPGVGYDCRAHKGHKGVHIAGIVPIASGDWEAKIYAIWK